MSVFLIIMLVVGGVYVLLLLLLSLRVDVKEPAPADTAKISLIIPAKNEEEHLPRCLESLGKLDYPSDKLEIILVNHRSSDSSGGLMEQFQRNSRFSVKVVSLTGEDKLKIGKAEALLAGVECASGEVYAFIDAECRFAAGWLKAMAGQLAGGLDFAGGAIMMEDGGLFGCLQRLDWLFLAAVGSGFAGYGCPQSLFGKNMIITRDLYDKSGGFVKEMVWTEDLDLVKRSYGKGTIGLNMGGSCAVYSVPAQTLKDFFLQRLRWIRGGRRIHPAGMAAMIFALGTNLFIIVSVLFDYRISLLLFVLKVLGDWIILRQALRIHGMSGSLIGVPFYSVFAIIYQTVLVVLSLFVKQPRWR